MWTQRDQLQALQFLRRRIVSALQFGDANHPVAPGRRVLLATVSGLAAALLAMGGFLVYGLVRPGSAADWRQPGQILVEKESGASHVLGADGLVHPMLNHTSARLLIGGGRTVAISAGRLAEAPRGRPLGIPGAPATLPAPDRLLSGPWTVCAGAPEETSGPENTSGPEDTSGPKNTSRPENTSGREETSRPEDTSRPDGTAPVTTVLIGTPLPADRLAPDQALVVTTADGARHVVTAGRRFRMRDTAAVALGYDGARPIPVSDAWLGALPAGPDLTPLAVRNAGDPGPRLAGTPTRLGQVLRTEDIGGADRYYVVAGRGFVPITQTEAALIVAGPANRAAYPDGVPRPLVVAAADVAASGAVAEPARASGYPHVLPQLPAARPGQPVLCAGGAGTGPLSLWTTAAPPVPAGARALPVGTRTAGTADRVYVGAGHGVLAGRPDGGSGAGPVTLITDQGVRFAVEGDDVKALGYAGAPVTPVATDLLTLLPEGPRLSAESAGAVAKEANQ